MYSACPASIWIRFWTSVFLPEKGEAPSYPWPSKTETFWCYVDSNSSGNGLSIQGLNVQNCHEMLFSMAIYYPPTTHWKILLSADIFTLIYHNGKELANVQTCNKIGLNPAISCHQKRLCRGIRKSLFYRSLKISSPFAACNLTKPSKVVVCGIWIFFLPKVNRPHKLEKYRVIVLPLFFSLLNWGCCVKRSSTLPTFADSSAILAATAESLCHLVAQWHDSYRKLPLRSKHLWLLVVVFHVLGINDITYLL